ncbi:hypothetical protein GQ54DRAFT_299781 [Martensiomyces pterosporus]|nr:hypothetical protein GQ54DRAFT_299781 [Martensiomyces pterosporus]
MKDDKQQSRKQEDAGAASLGDSSSSSSSVSSVTNIISDLREARAASQSKATEQEVGMGTESPRKSGEDDDERQLQCLFNTYSLVSQLTTAGFTRGQATAVMTLVKYKMHQGMSHVKSEMLTKSDLENDAYLFKAALQELRTEMQVIRKNDQAILESHAAAISRDIESLGQKTNDEVANLRSDIEIEVNNRKHETNHTMKSLDMKLHELASKYQVVMGEMKTDIEAIKLESIRRGLGAAVITALVVAGFIWFPMLSKKKREEAERRRRKGKQVGGDGDERADSQYSGADGWTRAVDLGHFDYSNVAAGNAGVLGTRGRGLSEGGHRTGVPGQGTNGILVPYDSTRLPGEGLPSRTPEPSYRNHSHLNIRYDPTISSAESQFGSITPSGSTSNGPSSADTTAVAGSGGPPPQGSAGTASGQEKQQDLYDDWFDSFFYSPQVIAERRKSSGKPASLMESDSKFDSTFWDARRPASSNGDKETKGRDVDNAAAESQNGAETSSKDSASASGASPSSPSSPSGVTSSVPLHFTYGEESSSEGQEESNTSSSSSSSSTK